MPVNISWLPLRPLAALTLYRRSFSKIVCYFNQKWHLLILPSNPEHAGLRGYWTTLWKLTFRWQYCLPHLTAVSCSLGSTPSAAKMPLCPANPMVICWFLTHLNESLWWPPNLSYHRRSVRYGWLAGLYAHPWGNTQTRSRWGGQAPGHSHTAGLGRELWEQKKYSNVDTAKATLRAKWGNTCLAQLACKNSLDLIPQTFCSLAFSSSCS